MHDLFRVATPWTLDAASMVVSSFGTDQATAEKHLGNARSTLTRIREQSRNATRIYPNEYEVEEATATLLYAAVRVVQPNSVLETGVADGLSSALMLAAMDANGFGELHSVDIASDVGAFVTDRRRWHLHIVDGGRADACADVIRSLDQLDMFLHDSNHEFAYQTSEYDAAWSRLRPGGYLMSDDIDWSYAFLDFVLKHELRPSMLMDRRKVFGSLRKL
jgi:predicted O-methyltransferase YrrM